MVEDNNKKDKLKAAAVTVVVHAVLVAFLAFLTLQVSEPEKDELEDGIPVMLGNVPDAGDAQEGNNMTPPEAENSSVEEQIPEEEHAPEPVPEKGTKEPLITQDKEPSVNLEEKKRQEEAERLAEEKKRQEEAEAKRVAEEKKRQKETERLAEEKKKQAEAEAKRIDEEKKHQEEAERIAEESRKQASAVTKFDPQSMLPYIDEFGYLRKLDASELAELKSVLLTAPKNNYQSQFLLGQLYIQENTSASNLRLAYDAIKTSSEHGIYEAGAFMAYFYLYGKVIPQDLDEAERRIKLDDDFKKNPIFVQMMIDLYTQKGNAMLADVWKSKLKKFK